MPLSFKNRANLNRFSYILEDPEYKKIYPILFDYGTFLIPPKRPTLASIKWKYTQKRRNIPFKQLTGAE